MHGLRYHVGWMWDGWYTGLFRTPSDRVFVSTSQGKLMVFERPEAQFRELELPATLFGVFGRREDDLYTFGDKGSGRPACFRTDGATFDELPTPPFAIDTMHAAGKDAPLYAAGGGLARLGADGWTRIPVDDAEPLVSVFAAADGNLYACGRLGGVFGGTDAGLTRLGTIPGCIQGDVQSVASYRGELWVAASRLGLWKRAADGSFFCHKPKLDAVSLDTRDGIVVAACKAKVSSSDDGLAFASTGHDYLLTHREGKRLGEP